MNNINKVEEIKKKIDDLMETWQGDDKRAEKIVSDIKLLNEEVQQELFTYFISKLYSREDILGYALRKPNEEFNKKLSETKDDFIKLSGLSSDKVDELFDLAGLKSENFIFDDEKVTEIDSYFSQFENQLKNLEEEAKNVDVNLEDWLKQKIDNLKFSDDVLKKSVNEIQKIINKIENSNINRRKELEKLANTQSRKAPKRKNDLEKEIQDAEISKNRLLDLMMYKNLQDFKNFNDSKLTDKQLINKIIKFVDANESSISSVYKVSNQSDLLKLKNEFVSKFYKNIKRNSLKINSDIIDVEHRIIDEEIVDNVRTTLPATRDSKNLGEEIRKLEVAKDIKKVDKKSNRKDLMYKGLAATSGFVTGMVLSSVPGVGTIRMVASTAKLAASGINAWTKKHPEGKVANVVKVTKDKFDDIFGTKIDEFKNNHPNISKGVAKARNVIKSDKFNYFVNGVAAGYVTGNIIEMVTGKTVLEHFKPNPEPIPDDVAVNIETPVVDNNYEVSLNPGDVYDISGITEGLTSSDAKNSVSLITKYGKEAVVDKFKTLPNGEVMVHFKDISGDGYAWFKEADIKKYLTKVAEAAAKTGKTL